MVVVGAAVVVVGAVTETVAAVSVDGDAGVVVDVAEAAAEVGDAWSESLLHAASRVKTGATTRTERRREITIGHSVRALATPPHRGNRPHGWKCDPLSLRSRSHDS